MRGWPGRWSRMPRRGQSPSSACGFARQRGPVSGQPYFLCPGQHNRPRQRKERVQRHAGPALGNQTKIQQKSLPFGRLFVMHPARIAPWVRCPDSHTLFGPVSGQPYSLWSGVRTAILSLPGWTQPAFVLLPGAGAQYASGGTPLPAKPEHRGPQPIQPGRVCQRRHAARGFRSSCGKPH